MAEQLHLSRQQLDDLVDCRLDEQGLLARSEEAGVTTTTSFCMEHGSVRIRAPLL
ncbi:hypothetical protein [Methanoculleus frigidifontis]|uniref:hypothetical protein n=1 Tax=Methanoculleus frigidifontis TaxID=2584085 RepID=UPI00265A7DD2|nr:hypothetical protein [Methanoculleus sp. FWC-SCC1]